MKTKAMQTIRERESAIEAAREAYTAERGSIEAKILAVLPGLSQEELMELAEECGEEEGPDHCFKCAAWHLYVSRDSQ